MKPKKKGTSSLAGFKIAALSPAVLHVIGLVKFIIIVMHGTWLRKKGENWTLVKGKLVNMSKWAGKPKCKGTVAHICKPFINGDQGLFCGTNGSEKLAYICEIPKGKTKVVFVFKIELGKSHAKSAH